MREDKPRILTSSPDISKPSVPWDLNSATDGKDGDGQGGEANGRILGLRAREMGPKTPKKTNGSRNVEGE